jgi:MFS transporter, BCD family, chlorophyll transporter
VPQSPAENRLQPNLSIEIDSSLCHLKMTIRGSHSTLARIDTPVILVCRRKWHSSQPVDESIAEARRVMERRTLNWFAIVRLGLVQTALGAIVVLTTSTMNRVMVVEMALPALLPGMLVAIHYAVQLSRPRWGFGSDVGGQRTPWIIGGMAVLAVGGVLAALCVLLMTVSVVAGTVLGIVAFVMIGLGVGAAGTSLLTLLAKNVVAERRAAAATIVWVMMIVGFIVTSAVAGAWLDPYAPSRLVAISSIVSVLAFGVAVLAVWGVEHPVSERTAQGPTSNEAPDASSKPGFMQAFNQVWGEPKARQFTIFIFVSMFAYSAQDLILEPFAGTIFGYSPGQSTKLASLQHSGVLAGMIGVALLASIFARAAMTRLKFLGSLGFWTVAGCLASAAALLALSLSGQAPETWPLQLIVFCLGAGNGAFAVAAIGSMMALATDGRQHREGTRMGLWGASQAIAFGLGGFCGAAGADLVRFLSGSALMGYSTVFLVEAILFVGSAFVAAQVWQMNSANSVGDAGARRANGSVIAVRPRLTDIGASMLAPPRSAASGAEQ